MKHFVQKIYDQHHGQMPPFKEDIIRFAHSHSWYKHFPSVQQGVVKYYVTLYKGEEPRYSFNPSYTNENPETGEFLSEAECALIQENYHWWFHDEIFIKQQQFYQSLTEQDKLEFDSEQEDDYVTHYFELPTEMLVITEKNPIYLNNRLSSHSEDECYLFQTKIIEFVCDQIWKEMLIYLK